MFNILLYAYLFISTYKRVNKKIHTYVFCASVIKKKKIKQSTQAPIRYFQIVLNNLHGKRLYRSIFLGESPIAIQTKSFAFRSFPGQRDRKIAQFPARLSSRMYIEKRGAIEVEGKSKE